MDNLLVIDDSGKREHLISAAYAWSEMTGVSVRILGLVSESLVRDTTRAIGAVGRVASAMAEDFVKEKEEDIIKALDSIGVSVKDNISITVGNPLEEIKKVIADTDPEMIVMTAGMKSGVLNITQEITGYTRSNCFIVISGFSSLQCKKIIVVSTGESEKDRVSLHTALRFAERSGGTLHILRVLDFNEEIYINAPELIEKAYAESKLLMDDELSLSREKGITAEGLLKEGQISEVIKKLSIDIDPDIVILGSHGRTGLNRILMGSIEGNISKKISCPLLVVKNPLKF